MSELEARTGRHQQRYSDGFRLVAGCIPFKYRIPQEEVVEVLMINSTSGPGDETDEEAALREAYEETGVRGDIVHMIGHYEFKSKTLQDEQSPEGLCKAVMFALLVKEELQSWPEPSTRCQTWLTVPEAIRCCRHSWMRQALEEGFSKWLGGHHRQII
ncbi:hypothetical protein SAY87_029305 [Trapa incisa]|uniref:Nudix hydrolase domain-containing protein n=1 Tax=Trapa incisa TaxID=236973 RepID=A0AAN7KC81_9MYRT|nr:hypothetical protein SAY87_029305 [Trapa incisa]